MKPIESLARTDIDVTPELLETTVPSKEVENLFHGKLLESPPESSTSYESILDAVSATKVVRNAPELVERDFEECFRAASELVFEDGIDNSFTKQFIDLVQKHNTDAFEVLTERIIGGRVAAEVAAEALRLLGIIEDDASYSWRKWLINRCLRNPSAKVRDGAIQGIAFLNDPSSTGYVESAIRRETVPELRHDMEEVLAQLRSN
jgi:hypothetical protein